jgi:putative chitinase
LLITVPILKDVYREAPVERLVLFHPFINYAMQQWDIHTSKERVAMFLAQIGHESGQLRWVQELASGAAYEGRKDLGNLFPGDGVKFKGRGLIQITGRKNYSWCGNDLGLPLLTNPELLETPKNAALSAAWYWNRTGLNKWADVGDLNTVTRLINGGYNGLADRTLLYKRALSAL